LHKVIDSGISDIEEAIDVVPIVIQDGVSEVENVEGKHREGWSSGVAIFFLGVLEYYQF